MGEIRTVTILTAKRDEILSTIRNYERKLNQAKADLAHVNATLRIFEGSGDIQTMSRYVDVHRLFKRHEKWAYIQKALADGQELSTREIAAKIIAARGLDTQDEILEMAMTKKLVQTLRLRAMSGHLVMTGKRKGMCVWQLA